MKYLIKGKLYDPILFGNEDENWTPDEENPTCGDCGCKLGQQHLQHCDIERCPACGLQLISCDCGVIYQVDEQNKNEVEHYTNLQKKENKDLEQKIKQLLNKNGSEM